MNNKSYNGASSIGRDKKMVLGMRAGCEFHIKGGVGTAGKECRSIPSQSLPSAAIRHPSQNPPLQIELGCLALAGQVLEPAA